MSTGNSQTVRSYCRVCMANCGILVEVEDGRAVRVRGDHSHPISRGYCCPKGRGIPELLYDPNRIERPLMKGPDGLQPTSWEACLDDLGTRLRAVIDKYGPLSVGINFGSGVGTDVGGYRMAEQLQQAIGTPARFSPLTIDSTAKTLIASLVGGFPGLAPQPDYDNARLVIYMGNNPMISHGHTNTLSNPVITIRAVAKRGEVWVIDPRRCETAEWATHHMAPRPGTDYAILAYLVREVLLDGPDIEALGVKAIGKEALKSAVMPFNRDYAARLSDVSPDDLTALLASVRKAGRVAFEIGTGVTMSVGSNLALWLGWVLMVLTDSMNRKGGVWFHPGFFWKKETMQIPIIEDPCGPGPKSRPELPSIVGDWPCVSVCDEILAGNMKALLNLGGSLIRSFPDANIMGPALQSLDVFATLEIVENETTALSTHVLPTKSALERPDVNMWDFYSSHVNGQYTPAVVDALGDRRSAWWVIAQIIRRLGKEPTGPIPDNYDTPGADDAMVAAFVTNARCSHAELVEKQYVEVPLELPAPWMDAHIENFGGWRLAPPKLLENLQALSAAHLNEHSEPGVLWLVPRRQKRHVNGQPTSLGDKPDIMLNPADATPLGIADGQPVLVKSSRGEIVGIARLDPGIRPGVVSVPHGHGEANVNYLTSIEAADTLTGMVLYSGIPVSVCPAPAKSAA